MPKIGRSVRADPPRRAFATEDGLNVQEVAYRVWLVWGKGSVGGGRTYAEALHAWRGYFARKGS